MIFFPIFFVVRGYNTLFALGFYANQNKTKRLRLNHSIAFCVSTLKKVKVYRENTIVHPQQRIAIVCYSPSLPLFFYNSSNFIRLYRCKSTKTLFFLQRIYPPKNIIYGKFYTFPLKSLPRFAFFESIHLIFHKSLALSQTPKGRVLKIRFFFCTILRLFYHHILQQYVRAESPKAPSTKFADESGEAKLSR